MDKVTKDAIKIAIEDGKIEWQRHAFERMMERNISRELVKKILISGEVIEDYPDDKPFPSALFLGWDEENPFHVVASYDSQTGYCFIITTYRPDIEHFESDYRTRRQHGK
ncbi:MAG: DUF4258 domain-containing protein [Candidatus Firestonebacteria bacterium]